MHAEPYFKFMPSISLFTFDRNLTREEIVSKLNKVRGDEFWFSARKSRFDEHEVIATFYYYESIDRMAKSFLDEEALLLLKQHNKTKVLRRVYMFFNLEHSVLEIYRGPDRVTTRIKHLVQKILGIKLRQLKITQTTLMKIIKDSKELKQAFFVNINGYLLQMFKAKNLKNNKTFLKFLMQNRDALVAATVKPRIKFIKNSYSVTINLNSSTIKMGRNSLSYRPRYEVRQITKNIYRLCLQVRPLYNFKIRKLI